MFLILGISFAFIFFLALSDFRVWRSPQNQSPSSLSSVEVRRSGALRFCGESLEDGGTSFL
jgi:hypothetical protein